MALRFRYTLPVVVATLLCTSLLLGQSKRPEDLGVGKLLVAQRDLLDPNFVESVVLLVDYSEEGAVGLIINHPTRFPVSRALPELKGSNNYSGPVYLGGPVTRGVVMALLQSQTEPLHARKHLFSNVYLISQKDDLETAFAAAVGSKELRIYLGYAGWGPGQLAEEVRRGDWYVLESSEQLVFDSDPATVWDRLIARTELRIARLLQFPKALF